jgi:poly-gamma-glutamate capsule biosynthesis protein CapA/YwtB (metallophosphatase superfamily)
VVVVSIHWGGNWGYEIPRWQTRLAHALVDDAGVDVVHGHSSHHPKGIEVYHGKLLLYGCGDLLTDYEGIEGYEEFRGDLGLMYFAEVDSRRGDLVGLTITPTRLARLRLNRAPTSQAQWLAETIDRESRPRGAKVELRSDGRLHVLTMRSLHQPARAPCGFRERREQRCPSSMDLQCGQATPTWV